ncbi:MAG: cell division protein FtsZ, partial [Paramuribaculum sp.]|nr:cell division protein FtsZ [Paramuribaculum sp.]
MDELAGNFEVSDAKAENKIYIKAVGVGGGGGNAVNYMYRQGIKNVAFAVVNTDAQALGSSPVPTKITIGTGLGAGNIPQVAKEAAEKDMEKIRSLFEDNTHMVFITATLGGGTGTGAGPVVAKIAKEKGLLTVGIVTIPFYFEGDSKIIKALDGVDEMAKYVDALLIINNDRLIDIYADLDFFNGLSKSDETHETDARSISEIINSEGRMNLDLK